MDVTTITNFRHSGAILDKVTAALKAGGWLAVPSETGYRLLYRADAPRPASLARLGWSPDRPASLLVRDIEEARKVARLSEREENLLQFFWPGPLALLAVRVPDGSPWRKVALRCSNHPLIAELLRRAEHPVFSRVLRDRQGAIFASPQRLAGFLTSMEMSDGYVLEANAPCLSLDATIVEIGSTSSRILRSGFITLQDLASALPAPIVLAEEPPARAVQNDELYPRVQFILLEGDGARLARRLKTLLETYAEPPLVLLSDETADWLAGAGLPAEGLQRLGPREGEMYPAHLGRAWKELTMRGEQRPVLMEGALRLGAGAVLMERLASQARLVINTDDPGYSGRASLA